MPIHLVIHGHFYQPPRENPWTGAIERQESAAPFHDWNARIAEECYLPNARARVLDEQGRIRDIVNNYERMSFNFGPTLLSWAAGASPDLLSAVEERTICRRAISHLLLPRRVLRRLAYGVTLRLLGLSGSLVPLTSQESRRNSPDH